MTDNKYAGEVTFAFGDAEYTLCYDWKAISAVQSKYGNKAFAELFDAPNLATLAGILAIGLKKNHPEMTADKVMDISPPAVEAVKLIDRAVAFAYFGADGLKEIEAQASEADEKKTT
jgi:hypothetical protein